ncbi:MAG: cytidylate kinase-like family protein, partial [Oscillospiraceae bacterium]|nr:cytidylate kinase-like family protein [Oscillospiraceae bacterium]
MANYPIITISRQFGSGGRDIGRLLAKELDIPYYDNELIAMAAEESGFSHELFENADKNASNSLLFSLSMYGAATG